MRSTAHTAVFMDPRKVHAPSKSVDCEPGEGHLPMLLQLPGYGAGGSWANSPRNFTLDRCPGRAAIPRPAFCEEIRQVPCPAEDPRLQTAFCVSSEPSRRSWGSSLPPRHGANRWRFPGAAIEPKVPNVPRPPPHPRRRSRHPPRVRRNRASGSPSTATVP